MVPDVNVDIILFFSCSDEPSPDDAKKFESANKEWELSFLKSPTEIVVENGKVSAIRLEKNSLQYVDIFFISLIQKKKRFCSIIMT